MGFYDIFRVMMVLLLLLGLMYFVLWLAKRFLFQNSAKGPSSHIIRVRATQMIMPKKFVSIIQVEQTNYIVGIAENGFTLLDKHPAPAEPEAPVVEDTLMRRLKGSIKF